MEEFNVDAHVSTFMFELGQQVKIVASNEQGKVVGRADYSHAQPSYLVLYRAADGRAVEQWWGQTAIESVVTD